MCQLHLLHNFVNIVKTQLIQIITQQQVFWVKDSNIKNIPSLFIQIVSSISSNWSQQSHTLILIFYNAAEKKTPTHFTLYKSIFPSPVASAAQSWPLIRWRESTAKRIDPPGGGCSSSGPRYSTLLTVRCVFKGPPNPPSRTPPSEQQPWVGECGSWNRRLLDNATSGEGSEVENDMLLWGFLCSLRSFYFLDFWCYRYILYSLNSLQAGTFGGNQSISTAGTRV